MQVTCTLSIKCHLQVRAGSSSSSSLLPLLSAAFRDTGLVSPSTDHPDHLPLTSILGVLDAIHVPNGVVPKKFQPCLQHMLDSSEMYGLPTPSLRRNGSERYVFGVHHVLAAFLKTVCARIDATISVAIDNGAKLEFQSFHLAAMDIIGVELRAMSGDDFREAMTIEQCIDFMNNECMCRTGVTLSTDLLKANFAYICPHNLAPDTLACYLVLLSGSMCFILGHSGAAFLRRAICTNIFRLPGEVVQPDNQSLLQEPNDT
jgi:hypothetical protein